MKKLFVLLSLALLPVIGCRDAQSTKPAADHGHSHFSGPPHGGTPVQIGSHDYHLELVRDADAGKFQAYVLDGHMEHYEAVSEKDFNLIATVGGKEERLRFERVPPPGSTNVIEKSSLFETSADWIKSATNFTAVIPQITLNAKTFTNITFSFPKGSAHSH